MAEQGRELLCTSPAPQPHLVIFWPMPKLTHSWVSPHQRSPAVRRPKCLPKTRCYSELRMFLGSSTRTSQEFPCTPNPLQIGPPLVSFYSDPASWISAFYPHYIQSNSKPVRWHGHQSNLPSQWEIHPCTQPRGYMPPGPMKTGL